MTAPSSTARSSALALWRDERRPRLQVARDLSDGAAPDSAEAAHLLGAYVISLVAEFQGFCADLLSEVVDVLLESLPPGTSPSTLLLLRTALTADRLVDTRNPTAANLNRDVIRFGMKLRDLVAPSRLRGLEAALRARNSLAHAGGSLQGLARDGALLDLRQVEEWERDLDDLATTLDAAVRKSLADRLGLTAQ